MANCPRCKKVVYANQQICTCGEKLATEIKAVLDRCGWRNGCPEVGTMRSGHDGPWFCHQHWAAVMGHKYTPSPINPVTVKFNNRLKEVDIYVDNLQRKNPGTTKRVACLNYLQERGIKLPSYVESQKEADDERTAIQQEGTLGKNSETRTRIGESPEDTSIPFR